MKKVKLSLLTALLVSTFACRKSDTSGSNPAGNSGVTNADAADMVAGAVSGNSNGVYGVALDASLNASVIVNTHLSCGAVKADTISRESKAGDPVTYSYDLKYNFTVNCSNNVPDNLTSKLTYNGSFSNSRISSTNSGSSVFSLDGLMPSVNDYVMNGEYKRSGSFASKVDSDEQGNSSVDIKINSLSIVKSTDKIAGGSAAVTVNGNVPNKGNFSYAGTLVFNGDGTAKLTLNAIVYNINLSTGTWVKVSA